MWKVVSHQGKVPSADFSPSFPSTTGSEGNEFPRMSFLKPELPAISAFISGNNKGREARRSSVLNPPYLGVHFWGVKC